mmetsp:Transcript_17786/g.54389  ORF Transcript_17786/g.54389 Transcript_17786/m.54389 type:complete len:386 (-) Transcript_17786:253-1410(-)
MAEEDAVRIVFRCNFRNTIHEVLRQRPGWVETDDEFDWDFTWADVHWVREMFSELQMDDGQRLNHFPNHYELTRKDLLVKNLKRMRRQLQRSDAHSEAAKYDFWAETFVLPGEYALFLEQFKRTRGAHWIMKPIGKAQGKGIFLFNKLSEISEWRKDHTWKADSPQAEAYIAQRYIENPYLVGNKKFDLRLYVLVTSYSPLIVWQYNAGFARFSFQRYESTAESTSDNLAMHLTNVAIQKKADDYDKKVGCKWDLRSLKLYMIGRHGVEAVDELFYDIQCVITRSLLAVQKTIMHDRHCFEMYGYDILIDSDLKPWLLEVNASPSLSADTRSDHNLKARLLSEMLDVIDLEGRLTGEETKIGGWHLIWANGPVEGSSSSYTGYST